MAQLEQVQHASCHLAGAVGSPTSSGTKCIKSAVKNKTQKTDPMAWTNLLKDNFLTCNLCRYQSQPHRHCGEGTPPQQIPTLLSPSPKKRNVQNYDISWSGGLVHFKSRAAAELKCDSCTGEKKWQQTSSGIPRSAGLYIKPLWVLRDPGAAPPIFRRGRTWYAVGKAAAPYTGYTAGGCVCVREGACV